MELKTAAYHYNWFANVGLWLGFGLDAVLVLTWLGFAAENPPKQITGQSFQTSPPPTPT